MVQANQLRLGNYLLNTCHDFPMLVKVTMLDNHQIGCSIQGVRVDLCYKFDNYKPITLTGKILSNLPQDQSFKIGSNNEGFFYYTSSGKFVKLDYLHQLQNLYFFIIGEELPVNLEHIAAETALSAATA